MKQLHITGTDLVSGSLSLGGVALGSQLDEKESFRLMDQFVEYGGNMIDSAEVYANWLPIEASISEKTIGKWMKERQNRHQLIVTTKGAHPKLETMHLSRLSRQDIVDDIEHSLQRLQVDTIDFYWLHRDDTSRPVGEILETLNDQVKTGKIRYFGCSNWTIARIAEARQYAAEHSIQGFSGNQMMWSLASVDKRRLEDPTLVAMDEEMKQFHQRTGLPAIPYASQAQGFFSKLDRGILSFDKENIPKRYYSVENQQRFERIRQLAEEEALTITQVVLGYLLSQPFVTIPIIGCYTIDQLTDCLQADQIRFTAQQRKWLETGNY